MGDSVALSQIPRPRLTEKFDRRLTEESFQALERDLTKKYDRRSDLVLEPGKSLVLANTGNTARYGLGISAENLLQLVDYSTGVTATFVVKWEGVSGAAQQIIDLTAAYEADDAALTTAFIAADAVVAADAVGARAALSTTLTTAYTAADTVLEGNLQADIDTRATITQLTATESTLNGSIAQVATDLASETSARTTADSGLQTDINTRATSAELTSVETTLTGSIAATATTLTAAYQSADSSLNTTLSAAYAAADTVVASNAASALASESSSLTAAFGAADSALSGTLTTAYQAADTTVAANAASSLASESSSLTAAYEADDATLQGNIDDEASARASADSASSTLITTLTSRVDGAESGLVKNARFQASFIGTATPPNWLSWSNGTGTFVSAAVGSGYAYSVAVGAGSYHGNYQVVSVQAGKKYLLSGEVRRTGGSFDGAGLSVLWLNGAGVTIGSSQIVFATDADTSGNISSTPDGVVRYEKEVEAPTGTASAALYAMAHNPGFGSIAVANSLYWREANLTPISLAQSQVTTTAGTVADIESNLTARYGISVDGGGNGAFVSLEDGTTEASSVVLGADEIILDGNAINFGSNTTFEDAYNSFYTEDGTYRNRFGGPFPASGDLVEWYGPETVALNSETKTNGIFAKATDGKIYYGTSELTTGGSMYATRTPATVTGGTNFPGTATTGTMTVSATGATGAVTYNWRSDDSGVIINSRTSAGTTFSRNVTSGGSDVYNVYCDVTDSTGATATAGGTARFTDTT